MLTATQVVKSFGGFEALSKCDLSVEKGTITGIIGPNGAGKSTLFNVLAGLMKPDSGSITLKGRNLIGLRPDQCAKAGLVRTFQISRELRGLTVLENVLLACTRQSGDAAWRCFASPGRVRADQEDAIARARKLLEEVNLWPLANEPAANLSGGQKKLLEIARALMQEPEIILLDEPAAGVSPLMIKVLGETIQRLRGQGITFAIIEHDMDVIAALCDPIYVLAEGRTLTSGTFREVTSNDEVMQAYLGKVS